MKFKSNSKDMNNTVHQTVYRILLKKSKPKRNCDPKTAVLDGKGWVYGNNFLKLGKAYNDSDSDSC